MYMRYILPGEDCGKQPVPATSWQRTLYVHYITMLGSL